MISELSSRQKYAIIIVGILVSLIMHVAILDVRFNSHSWIKALIAPATPTPLTQPLFSQKPITMTTHVPHAPRVHAPRTAQKPVPTPPISPTQLAAPQAQEPPAPTHRVYRAGTGFDAPQTDKPLATASAGHVKKSAAAPTQQQLPKQVLIPTPTATHPTISTQPHQDTSQFNPNRFPIVIHEKAEHTATAPIPHPSPVPAQHSTPTPQAPNAFSFLAQNKFNEIIQSDATGDNTNENTHTNNTNGFGSRSGVHEQYGDPRFLHYNSRVYSALQQSMNISLSRINQRYYHMILEDTHTPTRIRFALDQDGTVVQATITRSSGNQHYDALAKTIVQEASYPPIPASFNMHTTYHQYGIILYNDGTLNDHVGVSPYLEGE